jgi:hypothetical protein
VRARVRRHFAARARRVATPRALALNYASHSARGGLGTRSKSKGVCGGPAPPPIQL